MKVIDLLKDIVRYELRMESMSFLMVIDTYDNSYHNVYDTFDRLKAVKPQLKKSKYLEVTMNKEIKNKIIMLFSNFHQYEYINNLILTEYDYDLKEDEYNEIISAFANFR